jgi:hypothetical protein
MEPHETARPAVTGYLIVLVGVAGWVVGCFLPLFDIAQLGEGSVSLYRQSTFGSTWSDIGGVLYLFGGISAIFVISILGVLRVIRTGTRFLLAGAAIAWSLMSIGVLISLAGSFVGFNPGATLDVGYWCCWASVIVVIVGTVVVVMAERRRDADTGVVAPLVEVS